MNTQAAGFAALRGNDQNGAPTVIAVASGKGGVGKTFITVNMAVAAQRIGRRVLIVDGDLALANVDVAVGVTARHTVEDVLAGRVPLEDALIPGPGGVQILPGANGVL